MSLDPDKFKPKFHVPDGTYCVRCNGVVSKNRDGEPYVSKDGDPQHCLMLEEEGGTKKLKKYIVVKEDAEDLLRTFKAFGVTTAELEGSTWETFLDGDTLLAVIGGRTCEATVKNGTDKKDPTKTFMAIYLNPVGHAAERAAANAAGTPKAATPQAAALPRVAPASAPRPQAAPAPAPSRWAAKPAQPKAAPQDDSVPF